MQPWTPAATLLSLLAALGYTALEARRVSGAPRRFWGWIAAAIGAWLLMDLTAFAGEDADGVAFARVACLTALFVSFLLALEVRPHRPRQEEPVAARIWERAATIVFAFGVLLYATGYGAVPEAEERVYEVGRGSLVLGLALYLAARLVFLGRASEPRWRTVYLALAAGLSMLAVSEAIRLTAGATIVALTLRALSPIGIAAAAWWSSTSRPERDGLDLEGGEATEPLAGFWAGPLSFYAMSFPGVHLAGYSLGLLDPALQHAREGWALLLMVLLAGLAALQERGLEREVKDVTERFRRHSHYDLITGLPNRAWFLERVARSLARVGRAPDYQFAVLLLELDRSKLIEHGLGLSFGERMLVELGGRLKTCLRPGDMVARVGEDQFAILADHFRSARTAAHDADRVASRIEEQALGQPFQLDAREQGLGVTAREVAERIFDEVVRPPIELDASEVYLRGSIGISLSATGYQRAEDMLSDAQAAVARARRRGGATHEIFDPVMQAESLARLSLEADLHHAVERSEMLVHYHPIVRLADASVIGFEALLRWRHPQRGLVAPGEFLGVLEDTGLILPVSRRLIDLACLQTRVWQERFSRPLFLSFNFSGPQFTAGDIVESTLAALERSGLPGEQLRVEITEGVAIQNFDAVLGTLERLRAKGVLLLIDDFGTGYSSLSYLHRLPARGIKIDRSFVERLPDDPAAETLVRSMLELAHGLGREVIAEGIETAGQLARLRELGCQYGQGFYFNRPLDDSAVEALLGQHPV